MIPASCNERITREAAKGKLSGRTQEIQRLIGRSIRSIVDLKKLGERTIWLDADVIQGDGGPAQHRLRVATSRLNTHPELVDDGKLSASPVLDSVAAVSVGVVNGKPALDLCYSEDPRPRLI